MTKMIRLQPDADTYNLRRFKEIVNSGMITSYDGDACWATDTHYSLDHPVYLTRLPSTPPDGFTQIVWFNK